MKRILVALAIFISVLPAMRSVEAGVDISVDFFYDNLGADGSWVEVDEYGYCWQPNVAVSDRDWRPYTDGYWAYTEVGWTWVSYEDFGWATYHYGNWARVRDHGWIWVPGREWGPAWVSWRTGGDHIGWAPLPPRRGYDGNGEAVYEGRAIDGDVDLDFDIGPAYYTFIDIRYIGEPVLRQRILPPAQNITYINTTVNVTNITYNNSTVYNHGPDYNRLSAYSARPIQRLELKRESNVDFRSVKSGDRTRVQGGTLMVAAPREFKKAERSVAPKEVKRKFARADLETGWSGVSDEKTKTELQAKMRREDRKSIPPPKMEPQTPTALSAPSRGMTTTGDATPAASIAPEKENGRRNGRGKPTPETSRAPGAESTPASDAVGLTPDPKRGRRQLTPAPTPSGIATPPGDESGRGRSKGTSDRKSDGREGNHPRVISTPVQTMEKPSATPQEARGANRREGRLPDMQTSERPLKLQGGAPVATPPEMRKAPDRVPAPNPVPSGETGNGRGRGNHKAEPLNVPPPSRQIPETTPVRREQPAMRQERLAPPPQLTPQQVAPPRGPDRAGPPEGRPLRGKGKEKQGDEPAPTPER